MTHKRTYNIVSNDKYQMAKTKKTLSIISMFVATKCL